MSPQDADHSSCFAGEALPQGPAPSYDAPEGAADSHRRGPSQSSAATLTPACPRRQAPCALLGAACGSRDAHCDGPDRSAGSRGSTRGRPETGPRNFRTGVRARSLTAVAHLGRSRASWRSWRRSFSSRPRSTTKARARHIIFHFTSQYFPLFLAPCPPWHGGLWAEVRARWMEALPIAAADRRPPIRQVYR
jgi:hypothetical protein